MEYRINSEFQNHDIFYIEFVPTEILLNGSTLLRGAPGDTDQRIRTDRHAELRSDEIQRITLHSDPDPSLDPQFQTAATLTIRDELEEVAFEPVTKRHITVR